MKLVFTLALLGAGMASAATAQQQITIVDGGNISEFPMSVRGADGTLLRCRAGTTSETLQQGLICQRPGTGVVNVQKGGLQGPGMTVAISVAGLALLGVALGSSSGTN